MSTADRTNEQAKGKMKRHLHFVPMVLESPFSGSTIEDAYENRRNTTSEEGKELAKHSPVLTKELEDLYDNHNESGLSSYLRSIAAPPARFVHLNPRFDSQATLSLLNVSPVRSNPSFLC